MRRCSTPITNIGTGFPRSRNRFPANRADQDHPAELGISAGQGIVEGNETPRINYMPYPFEIVQTANQITILYEYVHTSRHLRLNSKHPEGAIRWFMGDSRARWDGETLVVDVTHFTD